MMAEVTKAVGNGVSLITGATGFLGSALVRELLARGESVRALRRAGSESAPPGVSWFDAELPKRLPTAAFAGVDRVFHLAAAVSFRRAERARLLTVNGEGTRAVLEAVAAAAPRARVIVVSSAITMGTAASPGRPRREPDRASASERRANPYLASKRAAEVAACAWANRGMDVVIANPTTVYGAGDARLNSGSLIASVAKGRVYPIPPGGCNVIDIGDVTRGLIATAERGESGRRHLLAGVNMTYADVMATVRGITGSRGFGLPLPLAARQVIVAGVRLVARLGGGRFLSPCLIGDLFRFRHFDASWTQRTLGWRPEVAFADSVRQAWEYYRAHGLL